MVQWIGHTLSKHPDRMLAKHLSGIAGSSPAGVRSVTTIGLFFGILPPLPPATLYATQWYFSKDSKVPRLLPFKRLIALRIALRCHFCSSKRKSFPLEALGVGYFFRSLTQLKPPAHPAILHFPKQAFGKGCRPAASWEAFVDWGEPPPTLHSL